MKRVFSSRIYEEPDGDTEAELRLVDLFNVHEYRTCGNYLYYLEPDSIADIYVEFPHTETAVSAPVIGESGATAQEIESQTVELTLSHEQKEELLAAIRQDIDEMHVTQVEPLYYLDEPKVSIDCMEPFIPQGEALKELLGDNYTPGSRVIFSETMYFSLGGNYPHTTAVMESILEEYR